MAGVVAMKSTRKALLAAATALTCAASLASCGTSGATPSSPPPPPPPPVVTVTITPSSASLFLGQTIPFSATVTNAGSTGVTWSVDNIPGGNATVGTISVAGVYTAPRILPIPADVAVTAASATVPSATASASVTIRSDASVSISPPSARIALNASQAFTAQVTGSGNPETGVNWSLAGAACSGTACGTLSITGPDAVRYAAPALLPSPATLSLTATSIADSAKSAVAGVTLTPACSPAVSVSPASVSVALGQQQSFTAVVCFTSSQDVSWTLSGTGCASGVCGSVSSTGPNTAAYTAPQGLPPGNPLRLVAASMVDPSQSGSASISVVSNVTVHLPFDFAVVALNRRQSISATVANTARQAVTWAVNGVVNGDASSGQICLAGSVPCAAPSGPVTGAVEYLAPASLPSANPVILTAVSAADVSRSASAELSVISRLRASVAPVAAVLAPLGTAQFIAQVEGTSNSSVTWRLSCAAAACGSIGADGVYQAPEVAASPNAISVLATSQEDPSASASATVAVSSGVVIKALAPASVSAGAAQAFELAVSGLHFAPSAPGPGSAVLLAGAPRSTTCPDTNHCSVILEPPDVASPGSLSIQVRNPDGSLSNPVGVVIVPAALDEQVISLSAARPLAAGMDLLAVQPTTDGAAASPPSILLVGSVDSTGAGCSLAAGPIRIPRPASGTTTVSLCLFGVDLDPSFTYSLSGPTSGDLALLAASSLGGLVQVSISVSAAAVPGPRTLYVTDPNQNRASATGAIEVQ